MSKVIYKGKVYEVGKWYLSATGEPVCLQDVSADESSLLVNPPTSSERWVVHAAPLDYIPHDLLGTVEEWGPTPGKMYAFWGGPGGGVSLRKYATLSGGGRYLDECAAGWDHCRPLTDEEWEGLRGE